MKTQLLKLGFFVLVITISSNRLMAFTAVADGDWTNPATWGGVAPSSNVSNQDIIIPSGIDVNLNTDVIFSGLLNNFTVDGSLMSTTTNELTFEMGTFGGSGDIDIQRIIFDGALTAYSFSGDITVNTFVNMGAALVMTSQATISDSLNLDAGTLTLNTGGNLTVSTGATIIRNDGSLATTGGVFNSSGEYNVHYIGGAKTTGIEINSLTLQHVNISLDDVATILTMGSDMVVQGDLELDNGIINVGANDLEIHGNIDLQTGTALTTTAASTLTIETDEDLNSGLMFTAGSSIDQFTIDYSGTGSVELGSPLAIAGELQLHDGTLSIEGGSTLTMNSGSLVQVMDGELESSGGTFVGTASYDVDYMSDSTITTGIEITGTGLNDVEVNLGEGELMLADNATVGGELELTNGKLNLNTNDLVLNGTLNQDAASPIIGNMDSDLHLNITVTGEDTLYMDDYDQNLAQLVVDLTGGDLVLGSMLYINDELTMTNGSIMLMDENLIIKQNADIIGFNDTRYIMTPWAGMLEMYVDVSSPYVVFPVGTTTNYSPASIQQANAATAGNFMVKAYDGVFVDGTQNGGFNSALTASVVNRTWWIESDATSLDMNLKLGWMATSEVNGFDRTNSFISHYEGSWDTQAGDNAVAGMNGTYEIDRSGITSLSPFTVADEDAELLVDENDLLTVNLYPNPCTDVINVDYVTANKYSYQVTDISGRIYDVVDNGSNQMDVSSLSTGSYLLRMTNVETNKTTVRQFVKN